MSTLIAKLNEAQIAPIVYRTARMLIDLITPEGITTVTWAEYQSITKCNHKEAARRHLRELAAAGLCNWQGGGNVVIWWAYPHAHGERVNIIGEADAHAERVNAQSERVNISEDAHVARVNAHVARVNAHAARVNGPPIGWLINTNTGNEVVMGQTEAEGEPAAKVGHALAVSLLLACRVAYPMAVKLADKTPFMEIRRQVAAWLPMASAARNAAGLLISRIDSRAPVPEAGPEFKRTRYYLDYMTPAERAEADREAAQREAFLAELAAAAETPAETPAEEEEGPEATEEAPAAAAARKSALDATWDAALKEILQPQPANSPMRAWLQDSRLQLAGMADNDAGLEVPYYRVLVRNPEGVPWLNNRVASALRRILGTMLGTRIVLEVAYMEIPDSQAEEE